MNFDSRFLFYAKAFVCKIFTPRSPELILCLSCFSVTAPPFLTRRPEPKPVAASIPSDNLSSEEKIFIIVEHSDLHELATADVKSEKMHGEHDDAAEVLVSYRN